MVKVKKEEETYPKCVQKRTDCFANKDGMCDCLRDTRFKNKKPCPFFKLKGTVNRDGIDEG